MKFLTVKKLSISWDCPIILVEILFLHILLMEINIMPLFFIYFTLIEHTYRYI